MVVAGKRLLPWMVVCAGLLIATYSGSRSFFIGFVAAGAYMVTISLASRNKARVLIISASLLLGLLGFLIFFIKTDSSRGRMLIYKISREMFRDHFVKGMGSDGFKTNYMHYQAAYFQQGNYTQQELLLADNTYFAFNDYWQFIIEYGLFGILLTFGSGILLAFALIRLPKEISLKPLYSIAAILLIAITIAACFNHVLEKPMIQLVFVNCVLIIAWGYLRPNTRKQFLLGVLCSILLSGSILFHAHNHQWFHRQAYRHWEKAKMLDRAGFLTESLNHCKLAMHSLGQNGSFLEYYGQQLVRARRYREATHILNHALNHRIHHSIYLQLGQCYQAIGDLEKAEHAFLKAIYMVPNRFGSRYALFNYYYATEQIEKALSCGNELLKLPVKIPSPSVDQIRSAVSDRLQKIKNLR